MVGQMLEVLDFVDNCLCVFLEKSNQAGVVGSDDEGLRDPAGEEPMDPPATGHQALLQHRI